jgi:hypothetical protein
MSPSPSRNGRAAETIRAERRLSLPPGSGRTSASGSNTRRTSLAPDPSWVAQFAALRDGFHRWNEWRTYQGMKGDPTLIQHLTRGLSLASAEV